MQANVDLQRGAQKVVEENTLLRRILVELGWEPVRIDKRLKELKDMAIADGNGCNISSCDNGCGETSGSGLDGVGLAMAASLDLDNPQFSNPPSEPAGVNKIQNTLGEGSIMEPVNTSSSGVDILQVNDNDNPLPSVFDPIFDLLENVPDSETPFDIARFLEPVLCPRIYHTRIYNIYKALLIDDIHRRFWTIHSKPTDHQLAG